MPSGYASARSGSPRSLKPGLVTKLFPNLFSLIAYLKFSRNSCWLRCLPSTDGRRGGASVREQSRGRTVMECDVGNLTALNLTEVATWGPEFEFRDACRVWFHRVVQPVFCVVGMVGNLMTVVVMTRPGMRSSTNTYLTALALSDIFSLLFTWALTFEHYPDNKGQEYLWYWRYWGCMYWLHDAFST
ncbi:hypothetical protein J6590_065544 [Homalodisca vitripennis]|nr:hypothetical protein J6590_065544 [Homalodisca vitripennis]